MTYWDKVVSRLDVPGLLLLIVGAAIGYGSKRIARRVFPKQAQRMNLLLKAVGVVMALLGGLILLDIIG